jgi:four helix bundle protein
MAKYEKFEDLPVWQEAVKLYNTVLDLLEDSRVPLPSSFRSQLDRAALSVSYNIAEAFEPMPAGERLSLLGEARESAGAVRSMMAVLIERPRLQPIRQQLSEIRTAAESCARQIRGWSNSVEGTGKKQPAPAASESGKRNEARAA